MPRSLSIAVLLSISLVVLNSHHASGAAASMSALETVIAGDGASVRELGLGQTVRGELAGGELASYTIRLKRDQFLFARVMQLGVDLVITVRHPSGRVLTETDLLTEGPEFISLTSDTTGDYRVDLQTFYPLASRGSYFVQVLKREPDAQTLAGKVDQLFAELDQPWMPGAVVVVLQDGEIVHTNAFGMADLEGDIPLTTTTPINICSIGKQLTAFAIALLAERGQLELEDDIRDHLPWIPDFGHQITIRHLIHHTSGLREIDDIWSMADRAGVPVHRSEVLRYVKQQRELNFPPGEQYLYCNTGYILLGEIIEAVTGSPFIEWMQANVLDPLGMHNTSFYHDVEELDDGFAWSYRVGPKGGFERYEMFPAWYVGAGNVFTTAEDLKRWLFHLEDPTICPRGVIEEMAQGWELENGGTTSYAFAQDRQTYRGLPTLEHGGGGWGYRSYIMRFPEHRFAVIVVSNFVFGKAFTRARQIADLFLSEHLTEEKPHDEYANRRRAFAIDPVLLDAYTGTYQQLSGATATITREGSQLFGMIAGLNRMAMYPESDSSFFIKEVDLRVVFDVEDGHHGSRFTLVTETDTVTYAGNGGASIEGPNLADYEGRYISGELDVQYVVLQESDQIWVQLPGGRKIPCTHVHDDLFRGPVFMMEFDRDGQSSVTAFRVSCDRSRNIRFHKE